MTSLAQPTFRAHAGQSRILRSGARFKVAVCGRRWGKTEVGAAYLLLRADELVARGHDASSLELWWGTPSWEVAQRGFNKLAKRTTPKGLPNPFYPLVRDSVNSPGRMEIRFKAGYKFKFIALEREDQGRGEGLHAFVGDEAGDLREGAWTSAIYPALADTMGTALLIGTPKGRNWFHGAYLRGVAGEDAEWESWTSPSWENPHLDKATISQAKRDLPDRVFRQEFGAEFLDDSGGVFRRVRSLVTSAADYRGPAPTRARGFEDPQRGVRYFAGWDPAKHQDYSVLNIDRLPERHTVHFWRRRGMSYDLQVDHVADTVRRYNATLWMDSTGAGDPLFDFMVKAGVDVHPYKFTHASKQDLVNNHALIVDQGATSWPDIPELTNEHEVYEWQENGRSSAPEGMHDDCVMAKALATWGASRPTQRLIVR